MGTTSKLTLSAGEMQLVCNTEWILTKRKIIDNVYSLFGNLSVIMQQLILTKPVVLPAAVLVQSAKIAKGESYLQLPYVLMDYPRCFDKENVFAVRTMFWWGNFFSCTLHISGTYKNIFEEVLQKKHTALQANNFYICVNKKEEWQHHFEADNYTSCVLLTNSQLHTIITEQPFIKLAVKFTLHQWDEMEALLEKSFVDVLQLLKV